MLEREARQKWCPFVRLPYGLENKAGAPLTAVNRIIGGGGHDIPDETHCVASACMAWRPDSVEMTRVDGSSRGHCGLVASL